MARAKTFPILAAALALAGCARQPVITVGAKNFTEQVILGEIAARHIERRLGVKVVRKLNLGGTLLTHQALLAGEIDLYPEYSGTALTNILKQPPLRDAARALDQVREAYRRQFQVEWLPPLGFNNTFAIATNAGGPRTLSEAAVSGRAWRFGAGYEFLQREDGYPGLVATYGLKMGGAPRSMDMSLVYRALEQKQVDLVAGNSTDGRLARGDLQVLEDDRRYFPPYEAAILVRTASLDRWPGLRKALEELSGQIPERRMQQLNAQVDGEHRRPAEVAEAFLNSLPRP